MVLHACYRSAIPPLPPVTSTVALALAAQVAKQSDTVVCLHLCYKLLYDLQIGKPHTYAWEDHGADPGLLEEMLRHVREDEVVIQDSQHSFTKADCAQTISLLSMMK